jgi:hypothetical protein
MRGQLRIGNAIVREIRPIDFKNSLTQLLAGGDVAINEITSEQWDNALLIDSDLIDGDVTEAVRLAFIQLNASFFSPAKSGNGLRSIKKLAQIEADLNIVCAGLIHHGHVDCWHYGWQFFQAVQDFYIDK